MLTGLAAPGKEIDRKSPGPPTEEVGRPVLLDDHTHWPTILASQIIEKRAKDDSGLCVRTGVAGATDVEPRPSLGQLRAQGRTVGDAIAERLVPRGIEVTTSIAILRDPEDAAPTMSRSKRCLRSADQHPEHHSDTIQIRWRPDAVRCLDRATRGPAHGTSRRTRRASEAEDGTPGPGTHRDDDGCCGDDDRDRDEGGVPPAQA